jgi:hypothetical protein
MSYGLLFNEFAEVEQYAPHKHPNLVLPLFAGVHFAPSAELPVDESINIQ